MTIQFTIIEQLQDGNWHFVWPDTAPAYKVVLAGRIQGIVTTNEFTFSGLGYSDFPSPIEVILSSLTTETETDPPFVRIQWYGDPAVFAYSVQKYNGTDWDEVFQIGEIGSGVYTYESPALADGSIHLYQVIGFNRNEDPSIGRQFGFTVITCPVVVESLYLTEYNNATQEIKVSLV